MEALTALSVASSVIQFVDFGSKLLSRSRKLYKSTQGVLTEHVDIEVITVDLINLTQGLRRKLPENRPLSTPLHNNHEHFEDDEAIDTICRRCLEIAQELIEQLNKLKVKVDDKKESFQRENKNAENELQIDKMTISPNNSRPIDTTLPFAFKPLTDEEREELAKRDRRQDEQKEAQDRKKFGLNITYRGMQFRRWESFRKALEASWNKKAIDELAATLREFRSEIEFRLLVSFRGSLKDLAIQQSQTHQQLVQSTQQILESFLSTRDGFADQLRLQAEKLLEIQESQKKQETVEVQKVEDLLQGKLYSGTLQSPKGIKDTEEQDAGSLARHSEVEEEIRLLMIENRILASLSFATRMERHESVELAYTKTFEWIYEESEDHSPKSWSNFVDWLREGSGIYWVNGKAGSGKSTLMRYIYENNKTRKELQRWAGAMPILVSGFFFWNNGDTEQKSQSGLLRSLLFELLQSHRDLLPEIMPDVWHDWSARATAMVSHKLPIDSQLLPPEPRPFTLIQLKRTFQILLKVLQEKAKLCLFIDGLDEYEGDYDDIVDLFEEHTTSPNIKLCLSSRPLVVFERAFTGLPSLRLQALTYGDINHYVKDRLYSHKYMIQLSKQHSAAVSLLVREIVEKASGVFLWVRLVVRSLLHGLRDHNRISDLQKRVRHLPADLEALYAHMLKHTDPFYHEQASQIFQIIRVAQNRSPEQVTLLTLSWAEDEDETLAETAPIRPLSTEEVQLRCQTMDARLKSVCVGLLESNDTRFSDIAPDAKVMFLHRTVSDWFAKQEVWSNLLSHTAGQQFSPNLSMLKASVLKLKSLDLKQTQALDMSIISNALQYAKAAEVDLNNGFSKLLDQLDIAASYQWRMSNANGHYQGIKLGNRKTASLSSSEENLDFEQILQRSTREYERQISKSLASKKLIGNHECLTIDQLTEECFDDTQGDEQEEEEEEEEEEENFQDAVSSFGKTGGFMSGNAAALYQARTYGNSRDWHSIQGGGILYHWSYAISFPGFKSLGPASTFYNLTRAIGLSHYVAMKDKSGIIVDQDVNQHLLAQSISCASGLKNINATACCPDPALIDKLLEGCADPNFSYVGVTPWENVLVAAVLHFTAHDAQDTQWRKTCEDWANVFEIFVKHGADLSLRSERQQRLPGYMRLTPLIVVDRYFPDFLVERRDKIKQLFKRKEKTHTEIASGEGDKRKSVIEEESVPNVEKSIFGWMKSWLRN